MVVTFLFPCTLSVRGATDDREREKAPLSSTSSGRGFHRLSAVGNIMGRGALWEMKSELSVAEVHTQTQGWPSL